MLLIDTTIKQSSPLRFVVLWVGNLSASINTKSKLQYVNGLGMCSTYCEFVRKLFPNPRVLNKPYPMLFLPGPVAFW